MTIWSSITEAIHGIGDSVGQFLGSLTRTSTAPEKSIAFTIGMIALGAKMARADGTVTYPEVEAFKEVFQVPEKDIPAVERVFNLAKQDVVGFESYAKQIARLFAKKATILENVMDGLFHIAKSDGIVREEELNYLRRVAQIFGFEESEFARIRSRHVQIEDDPFEILGVAPGTPFRDIKAKYRKLVRDLHPDKQIASGVPPEMVQLATDRMARINVAYGKIAQEHDQ